MEKEMEKEQEMIGTTAKSNNDLFSMVFLNSKTAPRGSGGEGKQIPA